MGLLDGWRKKADNGEMNNLLFRAFYQYLGKDLVVWLNTNKQDYVKDGYSDNEIVYAVIRILLSKLTEPPILVSKVVDDSKLRKFKSFQTKGGNGVDRMQAIQLSTKALEELQVHPLIDLLKRPNSYQSQAEFFEAAFGYYKLLGDCYIYGIGPGEDSKNFGTFTELHVLPAHLVAPVYSGDYKNPIKGYTFDIADKRVIIPANHVMHLHTWNPNWDMEGSQLQGLSPLKPGNKVLTRNNYNKQAQTKAFVNGGSAYLLSSANGDKPMTKEQVDLLNDRIKDQIKGPDNYRNVVATNGLVNATKVGDSVVDLQLIEADKSDVRKICMLFGVDPVLFDPDSSSYNNKEQALKALVSNVILSDLIKMRDKLSAFLLPGYEKNGEKLFIDFDTTVFSELQPDLKLMKEIYGDMWQFTPNEVRSVFNFDSIDDLDMNKVYIPSNLTPLDTVNMPTDAISKAIDEVGANVGYK
jgi:HK97 family phage portal protein